MWWTWLVAVRWCQDSLIVTVIIIVNDAASAFLGWNHWSFINVVNLCKNCPKIALPSYLMSVISQENFLLYTAIKCIILTNVMTWDDCHEDRRCKVHNKWSKMRWKAHRSPVIRLHCSILKSKILKSVLGWVKVNESDATELPWDAFSQVFYKICGSS